MTDLPLARNLYKWACGNEERIAKLESWQDSVLEQIAAGNGKEIVSTSGNGLSIGFSANQSNQDWFNVLTVALAYLNQGGPVSKIVGCVA
jgi:hypothetical protein